MQPFLRPFLGVLTASDVFCVYLYQTGGERRFLRLFNRKNVKEIYHSESITNVKNKLKKYNFFKRFFCQKVQRTKIPF